MIKSNSYNWNYTLPITKLKYTIPKKGIYVAKRGRGNKLASGVLHFTQRGIKFSSLSAEGNVNENQWDRIEKIKTTIEEGYKFLSQTPARQLLEKNRFRNLKISVEFLEENEYLMDVPQPLILCCDTDIADEINGKFTQGFRILYGMGLFHEFFHLIGFDEKEALSKTITFYEKLTPGDKKTLLNLLAQTKLDSGNVFQYFLEKSAYQLPAEKERLIAWIRIRSQIDLPYDERVVRSVLEEEKELDALREKVYRAINDTYEEQVEAENASRIADKCFEQGKRVVVGRFSRAFYIEAMLMASAKVLEGKCLQKKIGDLEKGVKKSLLRFESEKLKHSPLSFDKIGGELQEIINLSGEEKVSEVEARGVLERFKKALREFETSLISEIDRIQGEESKRIEEERRVRSRFSGSGSETWNKLLHDRNEIRAKVDRIMNYLGGVEGALATAPKLESAFIVFLQRIFPIDAINLATVNELKDPFFGEDEEIHQLIRRGGHNVYITPNLKAWLRKCSDWIEALPAYARYKIVPQQDGRYKIFASVDREILEDMYRSQAENWAINIEEVMALEHITLAKDLLRERKKTHQEIATLGAIIEATYLNLCDKVAHCSQENELKRIDALKKVIMEDKSEKNLAGLVLNKMHSAAEIVQTHSLKKRVEELYPLTSKPKRPLPSIHVLTTLGPGETEINVENWLSDAMALFNVSRAYSLEEDVVRRVNNYRRRLVALGKKIAEELELEGEIYNIIQQEELNDESEADKAKAILQLIASYPEVASEVAKLGVLKEYEEKATTPERNWDDADEPQQVIDYINTHPELEYEAIKKVITNNELDEGVKNYIHSHNVTEEEAARAIVKSKAEYEKEKLSIQRSIARQKLVRALGLDKEVKNYLRLRQRLAQVTARREIITENNLLHELNNPKFRYEARGPFKKFNLLYTPSRVDLGVEEVNSVRDIPKWVGGCDQAAAQAGKSLYRLSNSAGVTAVESPRLAEFLKVGENFFSRGGVFYLSLAAGVNIDTLRIGDFEFFRQQWNARGDRIVLPTGETYGGFCVPKEFCLLSAIISAGVNPETLAEILSRFGIPKELHYQIKDDLKKIFQRQANFDNVLDWEREAQRLLSQKYPNYFSKGLPFSLSKLTETLKKVGLLSSDPELERETSYHLANWVNKKAQGLEEVNRVGPFRKIYLIHELIKEARRRSPNIAQKLIGVMSASYKEGGRKDGKEIPTSDVRFSAGARKLEIYAGVAEKHLFHHLDPEAREIIQKMLYEMEPIADIRIVGTCTASDIFNHVPGSNLEEIKESVNQKLLEAGLNQSVIEANSKIYGGDLEQWSGIKEKTPEERQDLISELRDKIHLLVLDQRGVYRNYEEALQGVDFIDLGIPDPELLDLVDNLPKLLYLMKKGRPNSALVFADGTSGARPRTFSYRSGGSKRKVKELFALDDKVVYGALGLGRDTIEDWRKEMIKERQQAQALFTALTERKYKEAQERYEKIVTWIKGAEKAEEAAREEINAKKLGVWSKKHRYISEALGRIKQGLTLQELDFGTWLILGGMYILNGKVNQEELEKIRGKFEEAIQEMKEKFPSSLSFGSYSPELVSQITRAFVKPKYTPSPKEEYQEVETGIAGSLKATEEKVARLKSREIRRREVRRVAFLRVRKREMAGVLKQSLRDFTFEDLYRNAKRMLKDGKESVSQEAFGKFLGWAKPAFLTLVNSMSLTSKLKSKIETNINNFFSGGEISSDSYETLASDIATLAEEAKGNKEMLEKVAMLAELLDISLLIDKTTDVAEGEETMVALARFYDATLNSHIFDYFPYHYHRLRGVGFECYTRAEKFELATRRHQWLYTYIKHLMVAQTELKELGNHYQDAWLGDPARNIWGLGINVKDKAEQFWFSYARLRDTAVLRHEGYPFPELFLDLSPSVIKHTQRVNVVIVYPPGNTTVPVALEQGPRLAQEGINLILTPFPTVGTQPKSKKKLLYLNDGFMYLGKDDYQRALRATGVTHRVNQNQEGTLVAIKFTHPVIAHGIFFHFTHPLRCTIDSLNIPLIQPLVWEAATHLKCRLPAMLKGSGVKTPEQINWYQKQTLKLGERETKAEIKKKVLAFSKKYSPLIVKPEKESGGRGAKILPVRSNGKINIENVTKLTELIYEISKGDNVVIQEVLPCEVRRLYTREFLEEMVARFAKIGIPVLLEREPKTPLFSYFRQILIRGKRNYQISHHITVISTQGIANVGQGGLLFEYRDEIINPKYREALRQEITKASFNSLTAQRKYIQKHGSEILNEYLAIHPEFEGKLKLRGNKKVLPKFSFDIPYEMGDYMPVFLVDENDNLIRVYDEEKEKIIPLFDDTGKPQEKVKIYDKNGKPIPRVTKHGTPLPIPMFDKDGKPIPRYLKKGKSLVSITPLVIFKIEANPGAGLWRPHNDQLPPERKGEGVFTIFKCLGERAAIYQRKLNKFLPEKDKLSPEAQGNKTIYLSSQLKRNQSSESFQIIDEAVKKAKEELGG